MPVFEIEANGKRYEVDAPNQQAALAGVQGIKPQAPALQVNGGGFQVASSSGLPFPQPPPAPVREAQTGRTVLPESQQAEVDAYLARKVKDVSPFAQS